MSQAFSIREGPAEMKGIIKGTEQMTHNNYGGRDDRWKNQKNLPCIPMHGRAPTFLGRKIHIALLVHSIHQHMWRQNNIICFVVSHRSSAFRCTFITGTYTDIIRRWQIELKDKFYIDNIDIDILLFADDQVILVNSEHNLQRVIHGLIVIGKDYNMRISIDKTKVLALRG
jgi:hypothetical protein